MKEIKLTRGKVALVDDDMFDYLSQFKWQALKHYNTFYAVRGGKRKDGKRPLIRMHIEIMGEKDGCIIDHRDGNGLNNCRENMRHITQRQNIQCQHRLKSSKYPGVYWSKAAQKWHVQIMLNGSKKYLGIYADEHEAFLVYKNAVHTYTGQEVI